MSQIEKYEKRRTPFHGITYQIKLLLLCLKRGLAKGYDFSMGTEVREAGKFDDLIFKIKENIGSATRYKYLFLQFKHAQGQKKQINFLNLLWYKNDPFYLPTYFDSYLKIKNSTEFESNSVKEYIICTNWEFEWHTKGKNLLKHPFGEIHLEEAKDEDYFQFHGGSEVEESARRYNITDIKEDKVKLELVLKTEHGKLARQLLVGDSKNPDYELVVRYHEALNNEKIVDFATKKFHANFVIGVELSAEAMEFRQTVFEIGVKLAEFKANLRYSVVVEEDESFKTDSGFFWCKCKDKKLILPDWSGNEMKHEGASKHNRLPPNELRDFLCHLTYAVGQPDNVQLDEIIQKELGYTCDLNNSHIVAAYIKEYLLEWIIAPDGSFLSSEKGNQLFIEIKQILAQFKLAFLKLEYNVSIKESRITLKNLHSLRDFLNSQNNTLFIRTECAKLTSIKVFQTLQKLDHYKMDDGYIHMKLSSLILCKDLVKLAFTDNEKSPLLVIEKDQKMNEITRQMLKEISQYSKGLRKKIIFIGFERADITTSSAHRGDRTALVQDLSDSNGYWELPGDMQARLQDKIISFQGQDIYVKDLIQNISGSEMLISSTLTLDLIENAKIELGRNIEVPIVIHSGYLPRRLKREVIIKPQLLSAIKNSSDICLVYDQQQESGVNCFKTYHYQNTPGQARVRFLVDPNEEAAIELYDKLCQKHANNNSVHLLSLREGKLIWQQSRGSLDLLRSFRDPDDVESYEEEDFVSSINEEKIRSIIAPPGMGKSTFLTHVSKELKEIYPYRWIVLVKLNACQSYLDGIITQSHFDTFQFLSDCLQLESEFEKRVLHQCLECHGVMVLIDALDEICEKNQDKVIEIVKRLSASHMDRIWISSRPHLQSKLEDALSLTSYVLQPFSEFDLNKFLTNYYSRESKFSTDRTRQIQNFVDALVTKMKRSLDYCHSPTFVEIPLQAQMLAEVQYSNCEKFCSLDEVDWLDPFRHTYDGYFELYHHYIEYKRAVYESKAGAKSESGMFAKDIMDSYRREILQMHGYYAFYVLYPQQFSILKMPPKFDFQKMLNFGVVHQVDQNVEFMHNSVAIYFAAHCISSLLQNGLSRKMSTTLKQFLKSEIFKEKQHLLRVFLDFHLHATPAHLLAIKGYHGGNDVITSATVNEMDKQGRTALHLCAAYDHSPVASDLMRWGAEVNGYDQLFAWTPLQYALQSQSYAVACELVQNSADVNILSEIEKHRLLIGCCKMQQVAALENVINSMKSKTPLLKRLLCRTDCDGNHCFHYAAAGDIAMVEILQRQLKDDPDTLKGLILKAGRFSKNVLEIALENNNNPEVSKLLVECITTTVGGEKHGGIAENEMLDRMKCSSAVKRKEFVFSGFMFSKTELQRAVLKGEIQEVNKILNECPMDANEIHEQISCVCINGLNALHYAAWKGSVEIVNSLLEKMRSNPVAFKELLFTTASDGSNALHMAAMKGNADSLNALLNGLQRNPTETKEWITSVCSQGRNALHYAAWSGSVTSVNALLDRMSGIHLEDLNVLLASTCHNGRNALQYAVSESSVETLEALLGPLRDEPLRMKVIFSEDISDMNTLQWIARDGSAESMKFVVHTVSGNEEYGNRMLSKCADGMTVLHYAAENPAPGMVTTILDSMKDYPDELKHLVYSVDRNAKTALECADQSKNAETIQILNCMKKHPLELQEWSLNCQTRGWDSLSPLIKLTAIEAVGQSDERNSSSVQHLIDAMKEDPSQLKVLLSSVDSEGWNALHMAASYGFPDTVDALLDGVKESGSPLKQVLFSVDKNNQVALHLAALGGHCKIVTAMLDRVQNNWEDLKELIFLTNSLGNNSLHLAAQSGSPETVNALMDSMQGNHSELIKLIFSVNNQGCNALHFAAQLGTEETIEAFIEKVKHNPLQLHELLFSKDGSERNALHLAAKNGNHNVVNLLMKYLETDSLMLKELIFSCDANKRNSLQLAAQSKCPEIVKEFTDKMQNNASLLFELIFSVDSEKCNSLHLAARSGCDRTVRALMDSLRKHPSRVKSLIFSTDLKHKNAFHMAAESGFLQTVIALMKELGDSYSQLKELIFSAEGEDQVVLHLAALGGHHEIVTVILNRLQEDWEDLRNLIFLANSSGCNALHLAALSGSPATINAILEKVKGNPSEFNKLMFSTDSEGCNALHFAAKSGCYQAVNALTNSLEGSPSQLKKLILSVDSHKRNALHLAAQLGSPKTIKALTDRMQDNSSELFEFISSVDSKNCNLLHLAACSESRDAFNVITELSKCYPSEVRAMIVSTDTQGCSALHLAAKNGYHRTVKALMDSFEGHSTQLKNLVLSVDSNRCNALHWSACNESPETANAIIECVKYHPSELSPLMFARDSNGCNALHLAAKNGCHRTVSVLIKSLEDSPMQLMNLFFSVASNECNALHWSAYSEQSVETINAIIEQVKLHPSEFYKLMFLTDSKGCNALHFAAKKGCHQAVDTLLNSLEDNPSQLEKLIFSLDSHKRNALHLAARKGSHKTVKVLMDRLRNNTLQLFELILSVDSENGTALHFAVGSQSVETVNEIIKPMVCHPLDLLKMILSIDLNGINALNLAIETGCQSVVHLLMDTMRTAWHLAASSGVANTVEALIKFVKDNPKYLMELIFVVNSNKRNAFHLAAYNGSPETVKALLDLVQGTSTKFNELIFSVDSVGRNALHLACLKGCPETVKAILSRIKDNPIKVEELILSVDSHGWNALHFAAFKGCPETVKAIMDTLKGSSLCLQELIFAVTPIGSNALHLAAFNGSVETVTSLLAISKNSSHAQLKELIFKNNYNGRNALHLAALGANKVMFCTLLDSMNYGDREVETLLFMILKSDQNAYHVNGNWSIVITLLEWLEYSRLMPVTEMVSSVNYEVVPYVNLLYPFLKYINIVSSLSLKEHRANLSSYPP